MEPISVFWNWHLKIDNPVPLPLGHSLKVDTQRLPTKLVP